jgi:hypothetical protein
MQLLQDSAGIKDSIHPDTVVWSSIISFDSAQPAQSGDTLVDIFHGHELKPRHPMAQPLAHEGGNWIFAVVLLVVAIFAYLRVAYRKYLDQLLKAFFNMNMTNQIVRDENILIQRASLMLNIIFYASTAMLAFFISVHYDWQLKGMGTGFKRFLFLAMLIAAIYFIKLLVLKVIGSLFKIEREMSTYIFNIFLINNILGVALVPVVLLFVFTGYMQLNWLLIAGVSLAGCAYLYRIVRGILISLTTTSVSFTYLFLYICALEIAPLFIAIKLISEQ